MSNCTVIPLRTESSSATRAVPAGLEPLEPTLLGCAANDSGIRRRPTLEVSDLNVLVAGIVGDVAGRVVPERVNIGLRLAPTPPLIEADPTEIAFAISGVLTAELRAVEEADGGEVRVEVLRSPGNAQVVITAEEVPPLDLIRAVSPQPRHSGPQGSIDPTLAHCRRLIEAHGGTIELTEHAGRIGFVLAFPTVIVTQPVRMPQRADFETALPPLARAS